MPGYLYSLARITPQYIVLNLFKYFILKVFPLNGLKGFVGIVMTFKRVIIKVFSLNGLKGFVGIVMTFKRVIIKDFQNFSLNCLIFWDTYSTFKTQQTLLVLLPQLLNDFG